MNSNARFEIEAEAFRIMTGQMAPGKDPPMLSYPASYEERSRRFDEWWTMHGECVKTMISAFESILEDRADV